MANFSKSFNFRGGFQVDTDTLIVRGQNVGIGSSIPTERLDVDGIVKARGLIVDSTDSFFIETASVGLLSAYTAAAGIFTGTPENNGIATYYGDGGSLLNLPTSQWLDIDVGLGFTSIYAQGFVGVDTNDPRYVFQIGGTPFGSPDGIGTAIPPQDGVAIYDGNIEASGIVTTRGEFVGFGSLITGLNASNLQFGAIASDRYGALIVTQEVIADRLTGIASTAIGVTADAQLDFDSARANTIEATGKFLSTEGYLQIGLDVDDPNHGDIEVFKDFDNATIYSISTSAVSKVFIGQEREGGAQRQFGGLRKGAVGSDPISAPEDLDLVNYDVGNVNTYLHSGSGGQGATVGKFRWIYGQNDQILAEMDRQGTMNLYGSSLADQTLIVDGEGRFNDEVSIGGSMTADGDVWFNSTVTITDTVAAALVEASSLNVSGVATVSGLVAGSNDLIVVSDNIQMLGVASFTSSRFEIGADVIAPQFEGNLISTSIQFTGSMQGPGQFGVDGSGNLDSGNLQATRLESTGDLDVDGHSQLSSVASSGIATFGVTEILPVGIVSTITLQAEDVFSNTLAANQLNILNQVFFSDLDVSGTFDGPGGSGIDAAGNLTVSSIAAGGQFATQNFLATGIATVGTSLDITSGGITAPNGDLSISNISAGANISAVGTLSGQDLNLGGNISASGSLTIGNIGAAEITGTKLTSSGGEVVFGAIGLSLAVIDGGSKLQITVSENGSNVGVGEIDLV